MAGNFNLVRDAGGSPAYLLPFSKKTFAAILAGGGAELTLTVPENVNVAVFYYSPGVAVTVALNESVGVAPGAFTELPGELLKTGASVLPGDVLHFVSAVDPVEVRVAFFSNNVY